MPADLMDRWQAREASGNPVFPFEWALVYADGFRFPRHLEGRDRTTADAPRGDRILALEVIGPDVREAILPAGQIEAIVVRARVVREMQELKHGLIGGWIFGFLGRGLFNGITIDAVGRVRRVGVPSPFRSVWGRA